MRVLGLDLSTASSPNESRTGWALIDDKGLVSCGRYPRDTKGWLKLTSDERIVRIATEILSVIHDLKPEWIYAEAAFMRFVKAATPLLRLQGAVIFAASLASHTINLIPPSQWRKEIGVRGGRGGKLNGLVVVEGYLSICGMPFGGFSEDEKEAIGVAMGGMAELKRAGAP